MNTDKTHVKMSSERTVRQLTQRRTVLRFVQFFPAGAEITDMALGWHWYLDKLGAEIDGGTPPTDWDAFVAEVGPAYRPA